MESNDNATNSSHGSTHGQELKHHLNTKYKNDFLIIFPMNKKKNNRGCELQMVYSIWNRNTISKLLNEEGTLT